MKLGLHISPTVIANLKELAHEKIAQFLLSKLVVSDKINYIDQVGDKWSFLPSNKKDEDTWNSRFRQESSFAKVLSKIMVAELPEYELKNFINAYHSLTTFGDFNCKMVEGDELVWAFQKENIKSAEILGSSCMVTDRSRFTGHKTWQANPDIIKAVLAMKKNEDGKEIVHARALIHVGVCNDTKEKWKDVKGQTITVANRIYYGSKRGERAIIEFLKSQDIYWSVSLSGQAYFGRKPITSMPKSQAIGVMAGDPSVISGDRFSYKHSGDKIIFDNGGQ